MPKQETEMIVALDFDNEASVFTFLAELPENRGLKPYVKVGMELYYQYGNEMIHRLKAEGYRIFLDLKLHDIPNTVVSAMKILKDLNVEMINLHAKVGSQCMQQVAEIFQGTHTKVIAVTELTSTSSAMLRDELLCSKGMNETVVHYAKLAKTANLSGVVCSPHEVPRIKAACGDDFLCVTPGIRYTPSDDQVRITSPNQARLLGSDFIVVGRMLTKAEQPAIMYNKIITELQEV